MANSDFFDDLVRRGNTFNPLIVAEIGGKYAPIDVLCEMVRKAQASGADFVKFQTYTAETITSPDAMFTMESGEVMSQYQYFKSTELTPEDHALLDQECRQGGVGWFSTPSHVSDLALLEKFNPPAYKTGSDDLTNIPFLRAIAEKGRPMIVSTGMSTLAEIEGAVRAILSTGNRQLVLLHCVVSYPSRPQDANLRVIRTLQSAFDLPVGLSDHTTDGFTSVLATQLGVCMIEKHFTLDHAMKLPDHEASLDPAEWKKMVDNVRMVPLALGDEVKNIAATEEKWRKAARKSVVAIRPVARGQRITPQDLAIRRPTGGVPPADLELVSRSTALTDIPAGTLIQYNMLKYD